MSYTDTLVPGALPYEEERMPQEREDEASSVSSVPGSVLAVFGLLATLGLFTANPLLTAGSLLTLGGLVALLWRPGEPPVLLFAVGYQWIQVSTRIFHANVVGTDVAVLSATSTVYDAIPLGLVSLLVLAAGMRLVLRKLPITSPAETASETERFSVRKAVVLYVVAMVLSVAIDRSIVWGSGMQQILGAMMGIKWVAYFLLAYLVLRRRSGWIFLLAATGLEFVQGVGYFSEFKTVFFVLTLAVFTARVRLSTGTLIGGGVVLGIMLVLGSAWISVKMEYRDFLTQGERTQRTVVSQDEALAQFVDLVAQLDRHTIVEGFEPLAQRLAYVDFFALSMDYVPVVKEHENGKVWWDSVRHILMPRILFPDKPVLPSDSEFTMKYTGVRLASGDEGTSVSIGYVGESYIDFGIPWMFIPVFLLGIMWGFIYKYFVTRSLWALFGYSFAVAALLGAYKFEAAGIKLLGGMVMQFIVLALILRFAEEPLGRWMEGATQNDESNSEAGADAPPEFVHTAWR